MNFIDTILHQVSLIYHILCHTHTCAYAAAFWESNGCCQGGKLLTVLTNRNSFLAHWSLNYNKYGLVLLTFHSHLSFKVDEDFRPYGPNFLPSTLIQTYSIYEEVDIGSSSTSYTYICIMCKKLWY